MLSNRKRIRTAAVIFAIFLILGYRSYFPGCSFDAEGWKENKSQLGTRIRLGMADRIVSWKMLRGKNRSQVTDMLGEPPPTDYFSDWDLVYWLGPERGFLGIDSEWLVVKLDGNGNVDDFEIVRD